MDTTATNTHTRHSVANQFTCRGSKVELQHYRRQELYESWAHDFYSNEDHDAHEQQQDSAVHTDIVEQVLRVSRDGVEE